MTDSLPMYGGQAVIEGVMMRGARFCAIAVRAPDRSIVIETRPLSWIYTSRLVKIPFLRGLIVLWDALVLGMRALTFSANLQAGEEEKLEGPAMVLTVAVSLLIGVGLFFLVPAGAAYAMEQALGWSNAWINLIEGMVRLGLLIGYIVLIGRMAEVRRVFGYHGAEHMTINAFEAGEDLEVEKVAGYPLEHPRCGTAFLLTVVLFSILMFSLLGPMPLWLRLASRLALIPVLASLAYEYIRLTSRFQGRIWAKPLIAPNLALQRLTTRKPDREMLEVSIAAFRAMKEKEVPAPEPERAVL